jgi:hypothetical protein
MRRQVARDLEIAALAGGQYGVVSRAQLIDLGLAGTEIDHRVRAGRLHAVHRGVYAVGHAVVGVEGRWLAATLATRGALSHTSAAAAWDLMPVGSGAIHVTVAGDPGRARRRGVRVHRSATLEGTDVTTRRRIPITAPIRTVLDVAPGLKRRPLERVLDRAERLIDFAELQRRLTAHPTRPGSPALQAVLSHYVVGSVVTRSQVEEDFLALCDDHGLPRPAVNTRIEGVECDFVWRDARLNVEVDGYKFHRVRSVFVSDRERDVHLKLAGWQVLRFVYEHVTDRPRWVAAAIRRCLAS